MLCLAFIMLFMAAMFPVACLTPATGHGCGSPRYHGHEYDYCGQETTRPPAAAPAYVAPAGRR